MTNVTTRDTVYNAVLTKRADYIDEVREGGTRPASWTAEEIQERDDVDASIRTVRDVLAVMAEQGHVKRAKGGGRTHAKYRPPEEMRPDMPPRECSNCCVSGYRIPEQYGGLTAVVGEDDRLDVDAAPWLCPRCLAAYGRESVDDDADGLSLEARENANLSDSYGRDVV
jgi:hypothetical protein